MKRKSLHVKDNAIYDQFTKQQVIWTHGYGATDRYVTRNEWGALLLQWPVHVAIRLDETRWCPVAHIIVEPTVRNWKLFTKTDFTPYFFFTLVTSGARFTKLITPT